ncbi:MAG: hypothetical protein IJY18_04710 [Clostridia bacterium]|nr:hypothetical protein [Clostridia bacterium]
MKNVADNGELKLKKAHTAGALIFSLVLLFNPNINLIDLLPDFIAYFILASVFERAADCSPYFDEARQGFLRLGFLNLAKLPALLLVTFVRRGNTFDYDVIALVSFSFAVLELIFLIPTVKNIFEALFYLGQRSDASALIKDVSGMNAESLRSFTMLFSIFKCVLYSLPEMLRLTRSVGGGAYVSSGSRFYGPTVLAAILIGTVLGVIWLIRMIKYVRAVKAEGKFNDALISVAASDTSLSYSKKSELRYLYRTFLIIIIGAVFSFDLIFENFKSVNLIPASIFGAFITIGAYRIFGLSDVSRLKKWALLSGVAYIAVSAISYALEFKFLTSYGYEALLYDEVPESHTLYRVLTAASVIEAILLVALAVLLFIAIKSFTEKTLGLSPSDPSYRKIDREYHRSVNIKTGILTGLIASVGIVRLIDVIQKGAREILFTNSEDVSMPVIISSSWPWFSLVVTGINVLLVFYSVYYFNFIKEEMNS